MNLYQIATEYRQQLAQLQDLELPPEVIADTVEGMQGDLEQKLRAVIAYSLELDVLAAGADEAAKRMKERAQALSKRVEWLRDYALSAMQDTGLSEVATDEFAAKIAKKPASVQIEEGAEIPQEFMRVKTISEPDKAKLTDAITSGQYVRGVSVVQGYRLSIK